MTDGQKISVIVPHFNDPAGLDKCLAALTAQSQPAESFEIVVADNNSPQGAEAITAVIAGRAKLTVVTERGAGPARNGGVAASSCEILAFTDSDCLPEADWLAEGIRALEAYDIVGGRMTVLVGDEQAVTPAEAFERVFAFDNETYVLRKGFTVTANLFCRRATFDAVGQFATGVSEDIDWSHRARDAGLRMGYARDAVVGHPARANWSELRRKQQRINLELFNLAATRPRGKLLWSIRALALPASALVYTPKVLFTPKLRGWRQRLGALQMLYGLNLFRAADSTVRLVGKRNR